MAAHSTNFPLVSFPGKTKQTPRGAIQLSWNLLFKAHRVEWHSCSTVISGIGHTHSPSSQVSDELQTGEFLEGEGTMG